MKARINVSIGSHWLCGQGNVLSTYLLQEHLSMSKGERFRSQRSPSTHRTLYCYISTNGYEDLSNRGLWMISPLFRPGHNSIVVSALTFKPPACRSLELPVYQLEIRICGALLMINSWSHYTQYQHCGMRNTTGGLPWARGVNSRSSAWYDEDHYARWRNLFSHPLHRLRFAGSCSRHEFGSVHRSTHSRCHSIFTTKLVSKIPSLKDRNRFLTRQWSSWKTAIPLMLTWRLGWEKNPRPPLIVAVSFFSYGCRMFWTVRRALNSRGNIDFHAASVSFEGGLENVLL